MSSYSLFSQAIQLAQAQRAFHNHQFKIWGQIIYWTILKAWAIERKFKVWFFIHEITIDGQKREMIVSKGKGIQQPVTITDFRRVDSLKNLGVTLSQGP